MQMYGLTIRTYNNNAVYSHILLLSHTHFLKGTRKYGIQVSMVYLLVPNYAKVALGMSKLHI